MMKILGSLFLFISLLLSQEVKVYLEKEVITQGEPARLYLEASGDEIYFPPIEKIGDIPVAHTTRSESVVKRGNEYERRKSLIITFYPTQSLTIPSFKVTINNQEYHTKPLKLIVKKAKKGDKIQFWLKLSKKEAYVGEPIKAELVLKIKRSVNIVDYSFTPPKFDNFWVKELKSSNKYLEEHGDFLIKRITYLLFPQKAGVLKISPAVFKYAIPAKMTDMFGFSVTAPQWHTLVSQEKEVIAKPLPKEVDLVGDFNITLTPDKKEIQPNEPLNVTLKIEGVGNLESLDKIELNISNATVYADKPVVKERFEKGELHSTFTQKFSILASQDFTIPSIKLEYFSLKEEKLKELTTSPVSIKVKGATPVKESVKTSPLKSSSPQAQPISSRGFWEGFLAGVGASLGAFLLFWLFRKRPSFKRSREGKRVLLAKLLPHISKDPKVASLAQALYEEIYEGKKRRVKRKEVEKVLKDLV